MTEHKKFKVGQGQCPVCGSMEITYTTSELNDNVYSYKAVCDKCGTQFDEDYELTFCGVSKVYDKNDKLLANVLDTSGEELIPLD